MRERVAKAALRDADQERARSAREEELLGVLPRLTSTSLLLLFTMPRTAAAPGPVRADLPVLQALLVFIKIVDLLALADVALVERFRAGATALEDGARLPQ